MSRVILLVLVIICFLAISSALPIGVEKLGRYWDANSAANWPGSGIRFLVNTDGKDPVVISIKFGDSPTLSRFFMGSIVDCQEGQKFEINRDNLMIQMPLTLAKGVHEITLIRLTEAVYGESVGYTIFQDISISGGKIVAPRENNFPSNCGRKYKIAYFGDSFTAAYGVDGTPPCSYSPDTEDVRHSHAWITAQQLRADMQMVAWSGKGVVRNYGDAKPYSTDPLPTYYNRTLADIPDSYYDPHKFRADAAVVMLGTNDYSTQPNPSDEDFVNGLTTFANQIKSDYRCPVLLMCAPGAQGHQCANIEAAANNAGATFLRISDDAFNGGKGCDGHPNQETEKYIAAQEIPILQKLLGLV